LFGKREKAGYAGRKVEKPGAKSRVSGLAPGFRPAKKPGENPGKSGRSREKPGKAGPPGRGPKSGPPG